MSRAFLIIGSVIAHAVVIGVTSAHAQPEFPLTREYDSLMSQASRLEKAVNVPALTIEAHVKAREELKQASGRRLVLDEGRKIGSVPGIDVTAENSFIVQPGNTFGTLDVTIIGNVSEGRR